MNGAKPDSSGAVLKPGDFIARRSKEIGIVPYWQLLYHIVWSTKHRTPLLTPDVEPVVYAFLRSKATGLEATLFALNGTEDHVHMVVAIPPKIAVAKFVGQVKAVASTRFNKSGQSETPLFWQDGYGVFSLDRRRLPNHITYVEHQKEHHARGTTIPILERSTTAGDRFVREPMPTCGLDQENWRRELEGSHNNGVAVSQNSVSE